MKVQKQPLEVFCKKATLKNFTSYIHRERPVLESLFNNVEKYEKYM